MEYGVQARVILRANGTVDLKMRGECYSLLGNDVSEIVAIIEKLRRKHLERLAEKKVTETVADTVETH